MNNKLTDSHGRVITSLRISITQKCNLNCIYCHHEGESRKSGIEKMLESRAVYTKERLMHRRKKYFIDGVDVTGKTYKQFEILRQMQPAAHNFRWKIETMPYEE